MAKKLQSQVDELQSQLNSQKHAIVNSLRASYAAAEAREQSDGGRDEGHHQGTGQMARYTALKKEVQTEVDLYNSLYAKIKEAGIAAASKSANIQIVDPALVPDNPSRPRWLLNLGAGFLAALLGGVGAGFRLRRTGQQTAFPGRHPEWIGNANVSIIPVISEAGAPGGAPGLVQANRGILAHGSTRRGHA